MDSLTHALVGALIGTAFTAVPGLNQNPSVTIAIGVLASSLPDTDAVTKLFSNRKYLEVHRRFSHQIHVMPILAFILPLCFWYFTKANFWLYYGMSVAAIFSHLFLDSLNPYGTKLIPFYKHIKLNVVSSLDIVIIIMLIISLVLVHYTKNYYFTLIFPIYLLIRIIAFWIIKTRIKNSDNKIIKVSPISTYNPFKWHVIIEYEDHFKTASYYKRLINVDVVKKNTINEVAFNKIKETKEFKIFKNLAFAYNCTTSNKHEYEIYKFIDLKYRKKDYYYFQLLYYFKNGEICKTYLGFVFSDDKATKKIENKREYSK